MRKSSGLLEPRFGSWKAALKSEQNKKQIKIALTEEVRSCCFFCFSVKVHTFGTKPWGFAPNPTGKGYYPFPDPSH
jgi:hypothetical protein